MKQARIIYEGVETDDDGYAHWTKTSGGVISITCEGEIPAGWAFRVVWKRFLDKPLPFYTNDVTLEELIIDKPMIKTLFEIPQETWMNVQVLDMGDSGSSGDSDGTPVANTVINGISLGV